LERNKKVETQKTRFQHKNKETLPREKYIEKFMKKSAENGLFGF